MTDEDRKVDLEEAMRTFSGSSSEEQQAIVGRLQQALRDDPDTWVPMAFRLCVDQRTEAFPSQLQEVDGLPRKLIADSLIEEFGRRPLGSPQWRLLTSYDFFLDGMVFKPSWKALRERVDALQAGDDEAVDDLVHALPYMMMRGIGDQDVPAPEAYEVLERTIERLVPHLDVARHGYAMGDLAEQLRYFVGEKIWDEDDPTDNRLHWLAMCAMAYIDHACEKPADIIDYVRDYIEHMPGERPKWITEML